MYGQLYVAVRGQYVADLGRRIAVGGYRDAGEQAPARRARMDLHSVVPAVVEHGGQSLELSIGLRHICEPIGEKRDRRTIDLPESADSVERILGRPVQYGRLEQWCTSGGDDVSVFFGDQKRIDHRGLA